jgi:hypothetical protein
MVMLTVAVTLLPLPVSGTDAPVHLVVGRWIWQHGQVLPTDLFSYITEGQPFVAHSWLVEVMFYLLDRAAGPTGLILLRFALISVSLALMYRTARMLGAQLSSRL